MLSVTYKYACQHRYIIHPEKSVAICKQKKSKAVTDSWKLGHRIISNENQTTHLGIIRSSSKETDLNVINRISTARKTLYALMNTGCHGESGINPITATKIYQVYVVPRLLSGLEVLNLTNSNIADLEIFHRKTLRALQSLPKCTANCAVYLLLGTLPIEAELHRKQLSLLHSILRGENRTLLDILERRLLPMNYNQESFFCKSQNLLNLYNLPNVETLKILLPTKLEWKKHVKQAIDQKWYKSLQDEAASKSSMIYCNTNDLKPSTPHQVLKTLDTSMSEIKKAVTKVRMLTGSYILYGRQWQTEEQNLCKLCYLEQEDVKHILTE